MTDEPAAAKGKIIKDPELVAMAEVVELLDGLPFLCALRVLDWASRRYQSDVWSDKGRETAPADVAENPH